MRAFLAISLFAALAVAGCASNDDSSAAEDPAGNDTNTSATPTPPTATPEECSGVQPPVGPCVEPPADA